MMTAKDFALTVKEILDDYFEESNPGIKEMNETIGMISDQYALLSGDNEDTFPPLESEELNAAMDEDEDGDDGMYERDED